MQSTAIIGTGIAGMGCGYFLHRHDALTLYEQDDYPGGHTNTVTVQEEDRLVYIDTGFMVFNYKTYPRLCRLFERIHAPVKKTDMSFSVQHVPTGLEYGGSSLNHLFAQRRNLFNPSFIRMLGQINRFKSRHMRSCKRYHLSGCQCGDQVRREGNNLSRSQGRNFAGGHYAQLGCRQGGYLSSR